MRPKKKKKEKAIYVADCETDPFEHGSEILPFIWGLYWDGGYETFSTPAAFVEYISQIDCICYAHNGGKFDWHFILDFIEPGDELLIINGRLSRFTIGECQFRDSWNILPTSLANMEKEKVDYSIFKRGVRDKPENKKIIEDYLYSDCINLYRFVMGFIDRHGVCLTQAGAAMKAWGRIKPDCVPNDEGGVIYEEFSRFYYGGRCQAFQHGIVDGDLVMVDINSAYPRAMIETHPIGLTYVPGDCKDIAGCDFITVVGMGVGAFPFRGDDGSLTFPDDSEVREFTITGWEWIACRDEGLSKHYKIIEHYKFIELTDFSDYVFPLYAEKAEAKSLGDKIREILAKFDLNALYGKFGSNPENYECFRAASPDLKPDLEEGTVRGGWSFAGYLGDLCLVSRPLGEEAMRYYNVATAASITGYVRAFLWRAMRQCQGVVYCDTDSIVCRRAGDSLVMGKGLGEWSLDHEFEGGGIGGKKLYAFKKKGTDGKKQEDYKTAHKGAKLTFSEVLDVCRGLVVTYKPQAPTFSVRKPPSYVNRNIKMTGKK